MRSSVLGTGGSYAFGLVAIPLALHLLGPGLFGVWVALATVLAVGGLADLGVRTEIARRVSAALGEQRQAEIPQIVMQGTTLLMLTAGILVGVGLLVTPYLVAAVFPHATGPEIGQLQLVMRAVVGVVGLSVVLNGYFAVLAGVQRPDVQAYSGLAGVVAGFAVLLSGLLFGWGIWALFAGEATQVVVQSAIQAAWTRVLVPELGLRSLRLSPSGLGSYLSLSTMVLVLQVADVVDAQWDKLVLSRYVGATAVASFQVGTTLVLGARGLALLPLAPLLVAVTELGGERSKQLYARLSKATMALSVMALTGLIVFAQPFMALWLGQHSSVVGQSALVARMFALAMLANLVTVAPVLRCLALGRHRVAATQAVVNVVINGAVSVALTIHIGLVGALIGSIVGNCASIATLAMALRREPARDWLSVPWATMALGTILAATLWATGVVPASWTWWQLLPAAGGFLLLLGLDSVRIDALEPGQVMRGALLGQTEAPGHGHPAPQSSAA